MDLISSIQTSITLAGKLRDLSNKIQDADFRMLLADLSMSLADAKLEAAGLKEQLAELKELNQKQAEQLAQRAAGKPVFVDGGYRFEGEDGLFCTGCWDVYLRKVRLSAVAQDFLFAGKWKCPSCNAHFGGEF